VSEREEIAKRIYWTQHTVMHDHEELWRECKKQFIYLECAESIIEYQRRSQGVNALGPCTQAELDQWEKEKDTKTGRILLMWKERAEKAEAALAAQGASGELRQDDVIGNSRMKVDFGKPSTHHDQLQRGYGNRGRDK
jgi:hypothetical protein